MAPTEHSNPDGEAQAMPDTDPPDTDQPPDPETPAGEDADESASPEVIPPS